MVFELGLQHQSDYLVHNLAVQFCRTIWNVKTALTFAALLVTGSLVVLLYIWSGESKLVLVLALFTLGAALFLADWRPWEVDESKKAAYRPRLPNRTAGGRYAAAGQIRAGTDSSFTAYNITCDKRGISGVPEGEQAPQLWAWSQIDDILIDDRYDGQLPSLRLSFPNLRDPAEPAHAWIRFGPDQDPDSVLHQARLELRDAKIPKSSLYGLPPEERTWHLAKAMSSTEINISDQVESARSLYEQIRGGLAASGSLVNVRYDAPVRHIVKTIDALFIANGLLPMSREEKAELAEIGPEASFAELHWTLDWFAEQQGARIAFLDEQRDFDNGEHGRSDADYLVGLIPAQLADEWDGQMVGANAAQVVLDMP